MNDLVTKSFRVSKYIFFNHPTSYVLMCQEDETTIKKRSAPRLLLRKLHQGAAGFTDVFFCARDGGGEPKAELY